MDGVELGWVGVLDKADPRRTEVCYLLGWVWAAHISVTDRRVCIAWERFRDFMRNDSEAID